MKPKFLGVFLLAGGLFFLAGCAGSLSRYRARPSFPQEEGRLRVSGLSGEVEVYRDGYGVPHIFAENERDLFFAVGYVQAQDRLWEMVLLRALAEGRLCEVFGELGLSGVRAMDFPLSTYAIDRRQRILGMKFMGEVAAAALEEENPRVYGQLQSYCDGVNAFLRSHQNWAELPLEFQALGVKPEPWQVADVMSFGRFIGSMLCGNLPVELSRFLALREFGPVLGWELAPLFDHQGPTIVPPDLLHNRLPSPRALPPGGRPSDEEPAANLPLPAGRRLLAAHRAFLAGLRLDDSLGSNNWVVSGKMTESGNAMLANDPHLNHLEPSLFYLMHLKAGNIDAMGAAFPGNPYVILGHTRRLAWAATTSRADVQDLFVEKTDPGRPGKYLYRGEWLPFFEREEVIRVRAGGGFISRRLRVRHTVHGPVINETADLARDTPPLALRWTGWDLSRDLRVFQLAVSSASAADFLRRYRELPEKSPLLNIALSYDLLLHGQSIADFIEAMELLDIPNQNWVAADSDGHIIYLPGGLVPTRKKGLGAVPAPGESGEFDWNGFIPLSELPQAIDPARGWMVTANNEVVDAEWYPYVFATNYGEPWRAARIEELIQKLAPLSLEDMKAIQNDIYVTRAEWEVPIILAAVEKKGGDELVRRAVRELKNWDYQADLDSTAVVIFFQFTRELFRNVLEDESPRWEIFKLEGYPDMALNLWLGRGTSPFFDDKRTPHVVETRDDMIVKSLADAMAWVEKKYGTDPAGRRWGKVHWIKWYHPLGLFGEYRRLSVGPFPHLGADQTVRMAKTAGFGRQPYKTLVGPCLRHLIDLGDPDHALLVIDGSQSGQYLSPHYSDMHHLYLAGEYLIAVMNPEEVRRSAVRRLILTP